MSRRSSRCWQQRLTKAVVPPLVAGMLLTSSYGPVFANPTGGMVTSGTATIATTADAMTVTQTTNTVAINWQDFGIGVGETVNFVQPSASAIALNRVVGTDASNIYGALNANGKVFLLNPNGILFAPGSQVNVGGLVASTLSLTDSDLANGNYVFTTSGGASSVVNQGAIIGTDGSSAADHVVLLGPQVRNEGVIAARVTGLAAGDRVSLDFTGDKLLNVTVDTAAADGSAVNSGTITAAGGLVIMSAGTRDALLDTVVNNSGIIRAQSVSTSGGVIRLEGDLVEVGGTLEASGNAAGQAGGTVSIGGQNVLLTGRISTDGVSGGQIDVAASNAIIQSGGLTAGASDGSGGTVRLAADNRIVQTSTASVTADSATGQGGAVEVSAGRDGGVFTSATLTATGHSGGQVKLLGGRDITLAAAQVDVSGSDKGGSIMVGGGFNGSDPSVPNAATTLVNGASTLKADATGAGDGGKVVVWSDETTTYYGSISARGGHTAGDGGKIEVSSKDKLVYAGAADAGAPNGKAGTLLLDPANIIIDASAQYPQYTITPPDGGASSEFGNLITVLDNGNLVIVDENNGLFTQMSGAAYLYDGQTGALISALYGSENADITTVTVTELTNGNYVILDRGWHDGAGAAVWANGTTGVTGIISSSNSLVGSADGDLAYSEVTPLTNGNYVVTNPTWNDFTGAVTWGNGATGVNGVISAGNSLVGAASGDMIGGVVALTNGNYVVGSAFWNNQTGLVTWANGATGAKGVVSADSSLVGSAPGDRVGFDVTALTNGNYVVSSPEWNGGVGAVTLGSGTTGLTGAVSSSNSLVGSASGDKVGSAVTALPNGNYVVSSEDWNNATGAVTWGSGTSGVTDAVSSDNSLVGSTPGDSVGNYEVIVLANGNYVVSSTLWNNDGGAVTWGDGTSGVRGAVSSSNSLVGSPGSRVGTGQIVALANGNYVVGIPDWNGGIGAATWGNGTTGISGTVSSSNSLVGTTAGDGVGLGLTALTNGNYVVTSYGWNSASGAVTWGDGTTGITGEVAGSNSLVGSSGDNVGNGGVTALTNGNYVVTSYSWNASAGAVTWGNGASGTTGTISSSNSLVGSSSVIQVIPLVNGNYVVASPTWNNNAGAVTWGSGTSGVSGVVSSSNSLVGSVSGPANYAQLGGGEQVGLGWDTLIAVLPLANGDYVVSSAFWNNNTGAATWGSGTAGVTGEISSSNSLTGNSRSNLLGVTENAASGTFIGTWINNDGYMAVGLTDPNQMAYGLATGQNLSVTPGFITNTLNTGTNVTLAASNDITVNSDITADNPQGDAGDLMLSAGRSIHLNASITTDNGSLSLIANDQAANGVVDADRDTGAAAITMAAGTSINAGNGDVSIEMRDGAGLTNHDSGSITLGSISANTITAVNRGTSDDSNLVLANGAQLSATGAGTAIQLAVTQANSQFVNTSGSQTPLTAGNGRWLVYSQNPASDSRGSMASDFKQYNLAYGTSGNGGDILGSGNAFIHTLAPVITVGLTGTVTKTYDGTATASLTGDNYSVSGVVDGDSLAIQAPASGTYGSKNAGTGLDVTVDGLTIIGAGNGEATVYGYQLSSASASGAIGSIDAKAVTLSGITVGDKVYDSTTTAQLTGHTIDGLVGAETLNVIGAADFADRNAAGGKTVNITGLTLVDGASGGLADNYTLAGTTATAAAAITPRALTVTTGSVTKTYDGTTSAAGSAVATGGSRLYGTDSLSGGNFAFTDKNAGTGKSVTVSDVTVNDGNGGNNYTVSYVNNTTSAINKATLTITAAADTKTYDGTTTATATPTVTSGLQPGDAVTSLTEAYADKNAGSGKTLTVTGYTINDGNGGNNYTVTTVDSTGGSIDKATLTVNATGADKVYDGTTAATVTYGDDRVAGDTLTVSGTAAFADKNAGTGKTVNVTGITLSGSDADNYTLGGATASTTADITPAALTVTADNKTKTQGQVNPAFTATYSGLVAGDTPASLTGDLTLTSTADSTSAAGRYAIGLSGTLASPNYTVTYVDGVLTVMAMADPAYTGAIGTAGQFGSGGIGGGAGGVGPLGGSGLLGSGNGPGASGYWGERGGFASSGPGGGLTFTIFHGGINSGGLGQDWQEQQ